MFFMVFSKKIRKFKFEVSQNLKFPTLWLGTVKVLSEVTNFAFQCDCSFALTFRDVAFFEVFLKCFKEFHSFMVFQSIKFYNI